MTGDRIEATHTPSPPWAKGRFALAGSPVPVGPLVTLGVVAIHLALSALWPSLRGISSFTVLAVAYATYRDGLRSGTVSGLLAFTYLACSLSDKKLFEYGRPELERLGSLAIVIPAIVALVHSLKLRLIQSELENSLLAERAEHRRAEAAQEQRYRRLAESQARELDARVAQATRELAASMRSLEDVSTTIAHDLRNPVRYIVGYAEILNAELGAHFSPHHEQYLNRIRLNAALIESLINDLLDYTHSRTRPPQCAALDPRPVLADVLRRLGPEIEAAGAVVRMEGKLPQVWAAQRTLEQALTELLTNAIRFVRPGIPPVIDIRGELRPEGGRLIVRDNGVGVAEQDRELLFSPFAHLHAGTARSVAGVGLAIVASEMRRIGGDAGVEANSGPGSSFWLQFQPLQGEGPAWGAGTNQDNAGG